MKVCLGNLPPYVDEFDVDDWLSERGVVASDVAIARDGISGESWGFAYFDTEAGFSDVALRVRQGRGLGGRVVCVSEVFPANSQFLEVAANA